MPFLRPSLVLAVALAAAGCAIPGAGHVQQPPDDLPPSLSLVTGDAVAFTLYDTDPRSRDWRTVAEAAGIGDGTRALSALHAPLFAGAAVDLGAVEPWVGETAGMMLYQLDVDGSTDASTMYFADVRDRSALVRFLQRQGWSAKGTVQRAPVEGLRLWTRPGGGREAFTAVAVSDDAVVAARTAAALRTLLGAADDYATPERRATSEFAVEARRRVPAAVVFRSDLLRTQLRRPVQEDPALLEFARWATSAPSLDALRDGWFGLLASTHARGAVRVVGAANWIPDLAADVRLEPVDADVLERLPADVDGAIAIDDPGQHVAELLEVITDSEYSTEQDGAPGAPRVELFPLLERLDGESAIGLDREGGVLHLHVGSPEPEELARDLRAALRLAQLRATVEPGRDGVSIAVQLRARGAAGRSDPPSARDGAGPPFAAAGRPPRAPIAWLRTAATRCSGAAAGWLTWDEVDRFEFSVQMDTTPCAGPASPLRLLGVPNGAEAAEAGVGPLVG